MPPRRRSALELINHISAQTATLRQRTFLTPLLRGGKARLRVEGLIYEVTVRHARPGWWLCLCREGATADIVGEALPYERGEYLALWPALRLVLLEPLRDGDWLALPYNPTDAAQRFALPAPLVVRLVEGGQPFDRLIGRVEGQTVWYDEVDRRSDPLIAESLRVRLAEGHAQPDVPNLAPGERAVYALLWERSAAARQLTAAERQERQLRSALSLTGAQLVGYEVHGDEVLVYWERDGERRPPIRLDGGGSVVTAGVCLSGQDRNFDLASIVGVVEQAPAFARRHGGWYDDSDD
jgi:hypothetical protein